MGVAYVIAAESTREINSEEKSLVMEFIELMKLKMSKKKDLVFCVHSRWDKQSFLGKQELA